VNTYYVPPDQDIIPDKSLVLDPENVERYSEMLQYYQWTPLILMFCSVTFAIPGRLE